MHPKQDLDTLRNQLSYLNQKREELVLELGLIAQENNDLRENSAYLHTEQKIFFMDAQIKRILDEFSKLELEKLKTKSKAKSEKMLKRVDLQTKI